MNIEYEIRVLEVDKEKLIKRLEELGAQLIGDFDQKRYVFDTIPKQDSKWIRLRTNGKKTTLTFKSVEAATIDGTHEIEVEVSDFNKTCELLNACGINHRGYQENRRTQYILDGVEIDIDSWPLIPTYVEIEGKDEESVLAMVDKLELDKSKLTALDVMSVYDEVYHIDMNKIKELRF